MLKRRFALVLTLGAALSGLGVASAVADSTPTLPAVTTTTTAQGDAQNEQDGVDEQGAANDVATAATDVQAEADNESADDESGDQQDANDQSEEQGDNNDSDD